MADSKYKDLPGIAYDQADVYETEDLPESDQIQEGSEDESDSVERLHISASEAFNKFKGKHVVSKGVDFSDRISRKPRTGYNVIYGEWELPEEGAKETPLQKLRRLQCETKELYDEINEMKDKLQDKEQVKNLSEMIPQVQLLDEELISIKNLSSDKINNSADTQNTDLMNLVTYIETFKQTGSVKDGATKSKVSAKAEESKIEPGMMRYEMVYLPEKSRATDSRNIASLDQRLAHLETVIGTMSSEKLLKFNQTLKCQGVLDAAQQLGTKASLMDSNQLDAVENRISTLLHRMDSLAQKKSTPPDSDMEQKISEMYDILKQTEANVHILPQALERMLTLQDIHQQAARFNKSLTQLEEMQMQITTGIEGSKTLLQGVQESFASNLETIKKNITYLDERVKKLNK